MAIRPVRIYGDPVLRQRAAAVTAFDDTLRQLVEDMRETMAAYHGVGLAANQVGVLQRVLVVDVPLEDEQHARYALVNPVVTKREGSETGEEGCLSIPGIYEEIARARAIEVKAVDESGRPLQLVAEGYMARAILHEVDHLDGILFVDRLSLLKRQFLRHSLDSLARGEMPEGYKPPSAPGSLR